MSEQSPGWNMKRRVYEPTFICECDTPERRLYRVTSHEGDTVVVGYCDGCAALAAIDWNGETAAIEPATTVEVVEANGRALRYAYPTAEEAAEAFARPRRFDRRHHAMTPRQAAARGRRKLRRAVRRGVARHDTVVAAVWQHIARKAV